MSSPSPLPASPAPAPAPAAAHSVPAPGAALIELRQVSHEYPSTNSHDPALVLSDISLTVCENDVVALLGPSGCGKSTLVRIMAGLIHPTGGEVFFKGLPLRGVAPGISMVFQNFALFPWLSVRDNVLVPVEYLPAAEQQARLEKVLNTVGLGAYETSYPRELSGGMKQRVGIARALIAEPIVLCMDEPFSALDVLTAETLRSELARLIADPNHPLRTAVMVTHNIDEAAFLATKIVVLGTHPGRIEVVVPNNLPYPRDPEAKEFKAIVENLHNILTKSILPDTAVSDKVTVKTEGGRRRIAPAPLPYVNIGEITGLIDLLPDEPCDIFDLAEKLGKEFGAVVRVVKGAELLELVSTPGQDVHITELGKKLLAASLHDRKALLREQMMKLKLFELLVRLINLQPDKELAEELLLQELQTILPHEKPRLLLRTLINWGRSTEILTYDQRRHLLRCYTGERVRRSAKPLPPINPIPPEPPAPETPAAPAPAADTPPPPPPAAGV